jgi:uncharacterized protein
MSDPLRRLERYFTETAADTDLVVAFSGGVDSSVVATVATRMRGKEQVTAVFFDTPLVYDEDRECAARIARQNDLSFESIPFDALIIEQVRSNRVDRCYWCKRALMGILVDRYPEATVLDGTNADDDPSRRPGMKALEEAAIASPLRACGITKNEVRVIAAQLGLSNANRQSMPCQAVALPMDRPIDRSALQ